MFRALGLGLIGFRVQGFRAYRAYRVLGLRDRV